MQKLGRSREAIALEKEILASVKGSGINEPQALNEMAKPLIDYDLYDFAIPAFEYILQKYPNYHLTKENLHKCYIEKGSSDERNFVSSSS